MSLCAADDAKGTLIEPPNQLLISGILCNCESVFPRFRLHRTNPRTAAIQRTNAARFDAKIHSSAMHTYSVALRISGTDLDLADVSAKLRLTRTQTRGIGQPRSPNSVWPESMWKYEVRPGE